MNAVTITSTVMMSIYTTTYLWDDLYIKSMSIGIALSSFTVQLVVSCVICGSVGRKLDNIREVLDAVNGDQLTDREFRELLLFKDIAKNTRKYGFTIGGVSKQFHQALLLVVAYTEAKFLSGLSGTPADDLVKDPCFLKSYQDAYKIVHAKIPDIDPTIKDPAYFCCVAWVELDAMRDAGKADCTAAEATTLNALEDKVIAWANADAKLFGSLSGTPVDDLAKDPCFQKSYQDAYKIVHAKIPDIDPTIREPAYFCCVAWVELDAMRDAGKADCTAAEATTLGALEDKVVAWANAGDSLLLVVACTEAKFFGSLSGTPVDDLMADPCLKKSYQDAYELVHKKIPDIDPTITNPAYFCCISWVELDQLRVAAKKDCTAAEATTMGGLEDKVIAWANADACKDHKYTKDIQTCKKP
ncbi:unnamed protein product [Medioppia subpectinata]|uniref:Uncharacterized protein n=1 Tax=Medioppia subpectinata TaxID=1979941 RepID=A0A7R9PZ44_9ACAR|nr:unnamed protein product [Medioppia subpectinata]CAG2106537.1 unnamed protein product [Medioppia subpectinata]